MTPWYQEPIPFIEAAEIGTEKVIKDHSTIGIVVTTDGSIGEIPRNEYLDAEKTVIEELESIGKPYIVLLNSTHPMLPDTERLADKLKDEYKVPVLPINIETMQERDMYNILKAALYEFPIEQIKVNMPEWIAILKPDHYLKKEYINRIKEEVIEEEKGIDIEPKDEITFEEFGKMQFQVGEIISCEAVKKSKKLLCSQVKIGSQVKQIVYGIKAHYTPEEMVGKKVMVLVNLKPAKLAGVLSEGMLLCAEDENGELSLMVPEKKMPSGAEIC